MSDPQPTRHIEDAESDIDLSEAQGLEVAEPVAAVANFVVSSLVAVSSFLAIYLIALMLGALIHLLNGWFGAEQWLTDVGGFVERVLVYVDVALLLVFLFFDVLTFARGQFRRFKFS